MPGPSRSRLSRRGRAASGRSGFRARESRQQRFAGLSSNLTALGAASLGRMTHLAAGETTARADSPTAPSCQRHPRYRPECGPNRREEQRVRYEAGPERRQRKHLSIVEAVARHHARGVRLKGKPALDRQFRPCAIGGPAHRDEGPAVATIDKAARCILSEAIRADLDPTEQRCRSEQFVDRSVVGPMDHGIDGGSDGASPHCRHHLEVIDDLRNRCRERDRRTAHVESGSLQSER